VLNNPQPNWLGVLFAFVAPWLLGMQVLLAAKFIQKVFAVGTLFE
jgi:hypothetical protein